MNHTQKNNKVKNQSTSFYRLRRRLTSTEAAGVVRRQLVDLDVYIPDAGKMQYIIALNEWRERLANDIQVMTTTNYIFVWGEYCQSHKTKKNSIHTN